MLYNRFLRERQTKWEEEQKAITSYDQQKNLSPMKGEWDRLNTVDSQVLKDVAKRVDTSYQNFFRGIKKGQKIGYPKYQKRLEYTSFTYPGTQGYKILREVRGGLVYFHQIGNVKTKFDRPVQGKIKTITITKKNDKWYACFACDIGDIEPLPSTGKTIGIDLGVTNLAITSEGEFLPASRHLRDNEKKLATLQRTVSRRKKGSNRRKKAIHQLALLHEHIANQRKDQSNKVALNLLTRYDGIAMEDLKPLNMVKNRHLSKSIADASWGALKTRLEAKAKECGRVIAVVDPAYTSQICSNCGAIVPKKLSERRHVCPECGLDIHRDVNAAINILNRSGLVINE
jgi:putative transposase